MCLSHHIDSAFQQDRADAFAGRLLDTLNQGALCLMLSIGHRTGLFDVMASTGPALPERIATEAGLDDRYIREWLGAMLTGGVVEYEADAGTYRLPEDHAAVLTRNAGGDNVAVFAQYIAVLGGVEDDIVGCFREGGGVPYTRFPRFHEVMAEDSAQTVLAALFDHILPLAPDVMQRLDRGIHVLDLGCGSGRALNLMAARFPRSRFTGYDLSHDAIAVAGQEASELGLTNVRFEARDLSDFDLSATPRAFDFVTTFDAVHDQAKPRRLLAGIYRTLRPGGVYLMQDIHASSEQGENADHPLGTLLYTVSCMHCMTVSLAQGGDGLGAMWGRELATELLRDAGFRQVAIHRLDHDVQNDYYIIRK